MCLQCFEIFIIAQLNSRDLYTLISYIAYDQSHVYPYYNLSILQMNAQYQPHSSPYTVPISTYNKSSHQNVQQGNTNGGNGGYQLNPVTTNPFQAFKSVADNNSHRANVATYVGNTNIPNNNSIHPNQLQSVPRYPGNGVTTYQPNTGYPVEATYTSVGRRYAQQNNSHPPINNNIVNGLQSRIAYSNTNNQYSRINSNNVLPSNPNANSIINYLSSNNSRNVYSDYHKTDNTTTVGHHATVQSKAQRYRNIISQKNNTVGFSTVAVNAQSQRSASIPPSAVPVSTARQQNKEFRIMKEQIRQKQKEIQRKNQELDLKAKQIQELQLKQLANLEQIQLHQKRNIGKNHYSNSQISQYNSQASQFNNNFGMSSRQPRKNIFSYNNVARSTTNNILDQLETDNSNDHLNHIVKIEQHSDNRVYPNLLRQAQSLKKQLQTRNRELELLQHEKDRQVSQAKQLRQLLDSYKTRVNALEQKLHSTYSVLDKMEDTVKKAQRSERKNTKLKEKILKYQELNQLLIRQNQKLTQQLQSSTINNNNESNNTPTRQMSNIRNSQGGRNSLEIQGNSRYYNFGEPDNFEDNASFGSKLQSSISHNQQISQAQRHKQIQAQRHRQIQMEVQREKQKERQRQLQRQNQRKQAEARKLESEQLMKIQMQSQMQRQRQAYMRKKQEQQKFKEQEQRQKLIQANKQMQKQRQCQLLQDKLSRLELDNKRLAQQQLHLKKQSSYSVDNTEFSNHKSRLEIINQHHYPIEMSSLDQIQRDPYALRGSHTHNNFGIGQIDRQPAATNVQNLQSSSIHPQNINENREFLLIQDNHSPNYANYNISKRVNSSNESYKTCRDNEFEEVNQKIIRKKQSNAGYLKFHNSNCTSNSSQSKTRNFYKF